MRAIIGYAGDFRLEPAQERRLADAYPQIDFVFKRNGELTSGDLADAEAFVGFPTDEHLLAMPKLRWLQLPSAGADSYLSRESLKADVVVTNSSGVFGVPGAEHAMALMLAFTRRLHVLMRQQEQGVWKGLSDCLEFQDAVVAVIGLGDIGTETARKAKGMGAYVIGVKRVPADRPPFVDELATTDAVDEVLARADFIVASLPHTAHTDSFFDAARFRAMKRGAVFVNVGRGKTVDEQALEEALRSGHLDGAGLDVTAVEPLPPESPLWRMPNVIVTAHTLGVSPRKAERRTELLLDNFGRFLRGEKLSNVVSRTQGY